MLEDSKMDKKITNRSSQIQSHASGVDCRKNSELTHRSASRYNKKREGPGASKNDPSFKNVPVQRGKWQGERRNRPRGSSSADLGGAENTWQFQESIENLQRFDALETTMRPKRLRILPPQPSTSSSTYVWSSVNLILPETSTATASNNLVDIEHGSSFSGHPLCNSPHFSSAQSTYSVPSPALNIKCSTSGSPTDSRGSTPNPSSKKSRGASKIPEISAETRRPPNDKQIANTLMYGSEEESEGEEDLEPSYIPRVARYLLTEDDKVLEPSVLNAEVTLQWPPPAMPPAMPSSPKHMQTPATNDTFQPKNKFDFKWRGFPNPQILPNLRRETFSNVNCGSTALYSIPYDAFNAIWDREIMEHIVRETNRYAQQVAEAMLREATMHPFSRILKWKDTTVSELYVYFAIVISMGVVVKTRIEEYWNTTKDVFSTPEFSTYMKVDRFLLLGKCIHFNNNLNCDRETMSRQQAKLFKLQPIIDHVNNKFSSLYNLNQNIALDESLTMWKGRLDINQFINNKSATVGIKTYEVCESQSGYLWRFKVHAGHETPQDDSPVSGIIPALVLRLLKGLEHKGHTIWMDNFYNSPALARELKSRGFDCVGTLRTNRQFVPSQICNLTIRDMAVGQVCGCTSGDVDLVVWRDKNRVALLSTYHGIGTTMCGDVLKPTIAHWSILNN